MKRLVFSFVLFLFSSLFILSGCYTSFKVQERERTYESVIPDSDRVVVQNDTYRYDDFRFQSSWYFGYRYPYWYRDAYWYSPWNNLWYGFYWDGYGFGHWNHWYNRPYYTNPNWWNTYQPPNINNRSIRFRTRDNDGGRGIRRPDTQKPRDQNPPPENTEERKRDTRTRDGNIRDDQNREKVRDSGERIRDARPVEKKPPQTTEPRKEPNSERQRSPQVTPPKKDPSSDRERKEPTRTAPQDNPTREKSSNENPVKKEQTSERKR